MRIKLICLLLCVTMSGAVLAESTLTAVGSNPYLALWNTPFIAGGKGLAQAAASARSPPRRCWRRSRGKASPFAARSMPNPRVRNISTACGSSFADAGPFPADSLVALHPLYAGPALHRHLRPTNVPGHADRTQHAGDGDGELH